MARDGLLRALTVSQNAVLIEECLLLQQRSTRGLNGSSCFTRHRSSLRAPGIQRDKAAALRRLAPAGGWVARRRGHISPGLSPRLQQTPQRVISVWKVCAAVWASHAGISGESAAASALLLGDGSGGGAVSEPPRTKGQSGAEVEHRLIRFPNEA